MIHEDLQTIGLTETEATIYTWLLDYGTAKPSEIAFGTVMKRPTVYSAVQELQRKGIITMSGAARDTRISPQPPHVLQTIIEKESKRIQEKKRATQRVINLLLKEDESQEYLKRDKFEHSDDLTTHLTQRVEHLQESNQAQQIIGWAYTDTRTNIPFITILQDIATAVALAVPIQILAYDKNQSSTETSHQPPLHIKHWTGPELFATNSLIVGQTALYVYKKAGIFHVTEIVDTIIVNQMKSLWGVLWEYNTPSAHRDFAV